jgi:hypothetical protein
MKTTDVLIIGGSAAGMNLRLQWRVSGKAQAKPVSLQKF